MLGHFGSETFGLLRQSMALLRFQHSSPPSPLRLSTCSSLFFVQCLNYRLEQTLIRLLVLYLLDNHSSQGDGMSCDRQQRTSLRG